MHILYIHQFFNLPFMTGSIRSFEFAESLVKSGYQVTVITTNRDKSKMPPKLYNGINIIWLNVPYSNTYNFQKRLISFLKYSILVFVSSVRLGYDKIYVSSTPLTALIPVIFLHLLFKKKFIYEVRDVWPEIPISLGILKGKYFIFASKKVAKFGYKHSESIVVLSNDMAREISMRYKINKNKIFVLPNFSSHKYYMFTPDEIIYTRKSITVEHEIIIIYPGSFGIVNNIDFIVHLAYGLRNSSYFFLLIGDGSEFDRIYSLSIALGLKNISIMKSVPKHDIYRYISSSDILISTVLDVPELEWNSANKYFDALSAGLPVIINYKGWQSTEIIKHQCGIVLSSNIQEAINQLLMLDTKKIEEYKKNSFNLSFKYQKEDIYKRLIALINSDFSISKLY